MFSSEHGTRVPFTEITTPSLRGRAPNGLCTSLVVDGVVHWLWLTNRESYVFMLNLKSGRVTVTKLPTRFPLAEGSNYFYDPDIYLLATNSTWRGPIVLVADDDQISVWVQCRHSKRWEGEDTAGDRQRRYPTLQQCRRFAPKEGLCQPTTGSPRGAGQC